MSTTAIAEIHVQLAEKGHMRRSVSLIILSLIASSGPAWTGDIIPERIVQRAQERVKTGQYPVIVIGVINGAMAEIAGFGRLPNGTPADGNTVFEIGSVTKTFTATLVASATTKGELRVNQPVTDLLPSWTFPAATRKITIADVAAHRSGMPYMPDNFTPANGTNPYADYGMDKLKLFLAGYRLQRQPGAQYEYSNLGYALLGAALAEHAKTNYRELLRQIIFAPLSMNDSDVTANSALATRLAPGRNEQGRPASNWDFDAFAPAGAIRSTGADMMRYLKANMNAVPGTPMFTAQQPIAAMNESNKIGLAWQITGRLGIVWHSGMTGGYACFIGFTADRKHGVVILTNAAAAIEDLGFATLVPQAPILPAYTAVTLPSYALDEVTGTFSLADGSEIAVFRSDEALYYQKKGQEPFLLIPSGPNEFFARIVPVAITFIRDASGKVDGIILHQNGDISGVKVAR